MKKILSLLSLFAFIVACSSSTDNSSKEDVVEETEIVVEKSEMVSDSLEVAIDSLTTEAEEDSSY